MDADSEADKPILTDLIEKLKDACRVAGKPVPSVFAAYCLCTLAQEDDHGPRKFLIDAYISEREVHQSKGHLPAEFAPAVRRACGEVPPVELPLVACLKLQALYEAAVIRESSLYMKTSEHSTANAVADEVLATPFTTVRNEKLLLDLYRNLNRFCYTQFRQESWGLPFGDEEALRREFGAVFEWSLPVKAVRCFLAFPREGRSKYLRELYHIVLGACIVHRQAAKKLQFPDPRTLFSKDSLTAVEDLKAWVEGQNQQSQSLCNFWLQKEAKPSPTDFCQDDLRLIAREQLYLVQALEYCRTLKEALEHCSKAMRTAVFQCFPAIVSAETACAEKKPAREVLFPLFVKIALHYRQAFCQRQRLNCLLRLSTTLKNLLESHTPNSLVEQVTANNFRRLSRDTSSNEIPNNDIFSTEEDCALSDEGSAHPSASPISSGCCALEPSCELNGYCPWMLLQNNGALVPGDNQHGFVVIGGCNCTFSSIRAREECEKHGQGFVQGLRARLLDTPPLIHFLKADRIFPSKSLPEQVVPLLNLPPQAEPPVCATNTPVISPILPSSIEL